MRVAFYAPMKSATSPVPSGDRQMARNLVRALEIAGHQVQVPSRFVSRDGTGDSLRQERLAGLGAALVDRLVRRWDGGGDVPQAWFTYHVYHKSPDWLGPRIRSRLGIPYVIAEASHAPKQAGGRWAIGYRGAEMAIRAADAVIGLSSNDAACVLPLLSQPERYHRLLPFTDVRPFSAAAATGRARGAGPATVPVVLAVAMMRRGDKLASYRQLARAMQSLVDLPWTMLIVGDGPARGEVEAAFGGLPPDRVRWAGAVPGSDLPDICACADLMVWPAVNEAYGMALLEAQSAGLPVIAGRSGGVADIVCDGETGLLTEPGDVAALAGAARTLLLDAGLRRRMSGAALGKTQAEHDLGAAARLLGSVLDGCRAAALRHGACQEGGTP